MNIIFTHFGNSYYLEGTFKCAKKFNPKANIFLLGDNDNKYIAEQSNIKWIPFKSLMDKEINYIDGNYYHIGTANINNIPKHKHNFMRWFYIKNFIQYNNINKFYHFDSDVIICRDLNEIEHYLVDKDFYPSNSISGCGLKVNKIKCIKDLCDLIFKSLWNNKLNNEHKKRIKQAIAKGKQCNRSDMNYIGLYKKYNQNFGDLAWPIIPPKECGSVFDWNINTSTADQIKDYSYKFWMKDKKKEISFFNKIPFLSIYDIKGYHKYNIRANTLNMSWVSPVFFNEVLSNLGLLND